MSTPSWRPNEAGRPAGRSGGRGEAGFTLVEMVIAAALAAALFVVLARTISSATRGFDRQALRSGLYQGGRAAQDRMARELRTGGTPVIGSGEIEFPVDTDGDDVEDSVVRFARAGDRIVRQMNGGPEEILLDRVASLSFQGEDLTVIRIRLADGDTQVDLRTAVRHAN